MVQLVHIRKMNVLYFLMLVLLFLVIKLQGVWIREVLAV